MESQRPDGSVASGIGWCLVVVGLLAALMSSGAESMNGWIIWVAIANLGIGLGVLLLSLGYLVKAIWFLPGRNVEPVDQNVDLTPVRHCGWCGQRVAAPNLIVKSFRNLFRKLQTLNALLLTGKKVSSVAWTNEIARVFA